MGGDVAQLLDSGSMLESTWVKIKTHFGQGPASIHVQFVLAPRRIDPVEIAIASATNLRTTWHFLIRVRELGRVTCDDEAADVHWSARIVLGIGGSRYDEVV